MDGENNGKPYFLMDDLGGKPTIFGNTLIEVLLLENSQNKVVSNLLMLHEVMSHHHHLL